MSFSRFGGFGSAPSRSLAPVIRHSKTASAADLKERLACGKELADVAADCGIPLSTAQLILKLAEQGTQQHG